MLRDANPFDTAEPTWRRKRPVVEWRWQSARHARLCSVEASGARPARLGETRPQRGEQPWPCSRQFDPLSVVRQCHSVGKLLIRCLVIEFVTDVREIRGLRSQTFDDGDRFVEAEVGGVRTRS